MAKCTICNKEIILNPSAADRAKKFGGVASDYTNMFTVHSECQVKQRSEASRELMYRLNKDYILKSTKKVLA